MHRLPRLATALAIAAMLSLPALAQAPAPRAKSSAGPSSDRLFLAFAEDPTLADRQWWEFRAEWADGSSDLPIDYLIGRINVAIQPIQQLEIGGTVGFGSTDTPPSIPDGSGATDLDVWGKWNFGGSGSTTFAAGAVVTIPTGDDTAGLGTDAFAVKGFGSIRHEFDEVIFVGHVGLRKTQDGSILGVPIDGKTSASASGAVLFPVAPSVTLVGEALVETNRFEGFDDVIQVLGGVDWKPAGAGVIRGALALGLSDGAPDVQLFAGYAFIF